MYLHFRNSAMRKYLQFFFLMMLAEFVQAQNLIGNCSFENYSQCPNALSQIYYSVGWENWCADADFYDSCSIATSVDVPNNWQGVQLAEDGDGYAGFFSYYSPASIPQHPKNIRDNIATELTSPLMIGQAYLISLYVCLSDKSTCASNNIGIKFTTKSFSQYGLGSLTTPLTNNVAQFNYNQVIIDQENWVKLSGSFIADSEYKYLVIGNFFDDSLTDTPLITPPYCYSYYYVDNISLTPDSGNNDAIGLIEMNDDKFLIYPNPTNNAINFSNEMKFFPGKNYMMSIISEEGEVVMRSGDITSQCIEVSGLVSGTYILEISNSELNIHRKFIKQ